jgi:urease accessory protein
MNNYHRTSSSILRLTRTVAIVGSTCFIPALALAHHSMGGKLPATFLDGFLSGVAHPVIGLDHLAMTLLIGAYCGTTRQGLKPLLAFVAAGLLGCLLHVARWDLPRAETGVAASLIIAGLVACAALTPRSALVVSVLGAAGVLHGYAYGESIVGAEATPLVAYLLGLSTVQAALGTAMWRIARPVSGEALQPGRLMLLRLLGVASAVIGAAALA